MIITHDLAIGGLQQVVVNICRTIDREHFDVSVLCLRELGEFTHEIESLGIRVLFLPQDPDRTDYFSFLKVANILRQEKIDIIHTHNTQPFVDGTIGALMSGVKTIVHTDHARDFPDKKRYMFAEWLMSLFAYKIVGVSDHTSKNLIKYEKISRRKIVTIPNGIDETKFDISIDKKKKKEDLGISKNGHVIGLCVRLTEQKGITYLLKAMPDVVKVMPDITLIIAGDGPLKKDLEKESDLLGVSDNVLLIGPRLDVSEILKLFDLYVLPSLWEGFPMVLLEAMAAKCPILATDVGGNPSAIVSGENGVLVPSRSPKALAEQIIYLLLNHDLRTKCAEKSLEIFQHNFSARGMTSKYEQLYRRNL